MTAYHSLDPNKKMDIEAILADLENYRPIRKGWVWRKVMEDGVQMGPFHFRNMSEPLQNGIGLPASKYFEDIDPQPECVVTTEIASGRFEDDLRRMRMAAWHGADHLMVIRTTGQSHIDGLMEGTPEGVGGVPITRKQLRASRKACDLIEEEVGRPINFHSYVSGVAGPEVAVLFAEEGVNGAHQDPQYNVLYRNINMYRSFVDAAEAKFIMTAGEIFQIDGAHNANATAKAGWLVMPELLVQHGINCAYSIASGMPKKLIGLSTVPPNSPPAPKLWYDLPYAVALRDVFSDFKMRAQQNTRYIESDVEEAIRTHTIDTLISMLTSADIQSTITPDEGRNVPWHYNNIRGVQTVKQTWSALDGIKELVSLNMDGPLGEMARDIKERAVAFLEEILEVGGYFAAVEQGFFVDSAQYPERSGDGIARDGQGGGIPSLTGDPGAGLGDVGLRGCEGLDIGVAPESDPSSMGRFDQQGARATAGVEHTVTATDTGEPRHRCGDRGSQRPRHVVLLVGPVLKRRGAQADAHLGGLVLDEEAHVEVGLAIVGSVGPAGMRRLDPRRARQFDLIGGVVARADEVGRDGEGRYGGHRAERPADAGGAVERETRSQRPQGLQGRALRAKVEPGTLIQKDVIDGAQAQDGA